MHCTTPRRVGVGPETGGKVFDPYGFSTMGGDKTLADVASEAGLTTFRGAVPLDRALAKPNVVYLGTSQPTARPFPGKVIPSPANCHSRA